MHNLQFCIQLVPPSPSPPETRFILCLVYVLFNDALNTFLINGYIGFGNILIGKIPSGFLTGIDLRSTACQTGAYTTRLSKKYILYCVMNSFSDKLEEKYINTILLKIKT